MTAAAQRAVAEAHALRRPEDEVAELHQLNAKNEAVVRILRDKGGCGRGVSAWAVLATGTDRGR